MTKIIILVILVISSFSGIYYLGKKNSNLEHFIENQNAIIQSSRQTNAVKSFQENLNKQSTSSSRSADIERLRNLPKKRPSN